MTDDQRVDRLLAHHDPEGTLLTVYLSVPSDIVGVREMWVRLERMLASVEVPPGVEGSGPRRTLAAETDSVRETVTNHVRDWLGHGVAILRSAPLGLREDVAVGWPVPDRAVVGPRPYLRPLLSAWQHAAPYVVVLVDQRRAWMYAVDGHGIEPVEERVDESMRDPSHAGWAGLEEYRVRQRAAELARRHYRATAERLGELVRKDGREVVVGGHEPTTAAFVDLLPDWLRAQLAGTFVIDPHTTTAGDIRTRSAETRAGLRTQRGHRIRSELADGAAHGAAVSGLGSCAEAVERNLVDLLVIDGDGAPPGYVCDQTGDLLVDQQTCPRCGRTARPVPNVVDELTVRVLRQRGQVEFVDADGAPDGMPWLGARLRGRLARRGA